MTRLTSVSLVSERERERERERARERASERVRETPREIAGDGGPIFVEAILFPSVLTCAKTHISTLVSLQVKVMRFTSSTSR